MTFVRPVVPYAAEAWALGAPQRAALDAVWKKCLRTCGGRAKRHRERVDDIRARLGATRLTTVIKQRRRGFFGHVVSFPEERLVRKMITARVTAEEHGRGKRKQWTKQIEQDLGKIRARVGTPNHR